MFETLHCLVSEKYPDLEKLVWENWSCLEAIRQLYKSLEAYLASQDAAQSNQGHVAGSRYGHRQEALMYVPSTIALAEGSVDCVLVLCLPLTIEEGLFA